MRIKNILKNKRAESYKNRKKKYINKKMLYNGSISVAASVIFVAIIVIVNLAVNRLPSTYTKFDVSNTELFTLSEQTVNLVEGLNEDVTLYLIAQDKHEDTTIAELLDRYKALSSHIKVVYKDPVLYPNFVSSYTSEDLNENSIIVESNKRSRVIDYSDIYQTTTDYTTYTQSTEFDGEGQLTSAIDFTTTDKLPVMYALEGHNEAVIPTALKQKIEKNNITVQSLNLLTSESVPTDCESLLIYAPLKDISVDEIKKISDYLNGGGNAFIISGLTEEELVNFNGLLEEFGVELSKELVFEGNGNYFAVPYNHYLLPDLNSHDITSPLMSRKMRVLLPYSLSITQLENADESLTIQPLLSSSDKAYGKIIDENTESTEKSDTDTEGPFNMAVTITKKPADDKEGRIILAGSEYLFDEGANQTVSGGNYDFAINAVSWLCDHESAISVHSKSMSEQYLVLTAADINVYSTIAIIFIPLAIIITGAVIVFRRSRC